MLYHNFAYMYLTSYPARSEFTHCKYAIGLVYLNTLHMDLGKLTSMFI